MNKHDWLWIGLKLSGLYCLIKTVLAIPHLLGGLLAMSLFWDYFTTRDPDSTDRLVTTFIKANGASSGTAALQFVVCGFFAYYLIKRTDRVLKWLCKKDEMTAPDQTVTPAPGG
ncbi:MAG TPA: hypothetical protein DCM28_18735 [Phycisphaerales bacterium]|nr:hypothetical protein [Phycisphaerales bacterium]HCD34170.1 hypothetical protein [Phycisphaerales bacterium]|tara:strand:+ start:384 stop:725 length:342 start_codon:yes stop_codon:yes gene_type:complete